MALTADQRAKVRYYVGMSDVSQGGDPNRLERAMDGISASGETLVTALLVQLAAVDTAMTSATTISAAGLKSVDNGGVVWQDGAAAIDDALARKGRMLVARLAAFFGIRIEADVFGSAVPMCGPMGLG